MVYVMTTQHIMNVMWGLYAYVMMTPLVKVFRIFLGALWPFSCKYVEKILVGERSENWYWEVKQKVNLVENINSNGGFIFSETTSENRDRRL